LWLAQAMALRITISSFCVCITVLRFATYNAPVFPFSDSTGMGDTRFSMQLNFVIITFFVEWLVTAVITLILR
jgi:hypothetical protein